MNANDGPHAFLFHKANKKAKGATTSRSNTIKLAMIPFTNTPKNGSPSSYLAGIAKIDPTAQRTNTTKSTFSDNGMGFQPFFITITLPSQNIALTVFK